MTTSGQDSIDSFLQGLHLEVEKEPAPPENAVSRKVRVVFSYINREYYLYCFALNALGREITATDFKGEIQKGEWTFEVESVASLAETLERQMDRADLHYNRDPPILPSPSHPIVSYRMVPHQADPGGHKLYIFLRRKIDDLWQERNNRL